MTIWIALALAQASKSEISDPASRLRALSEEVVSLTNRERSKEGLPILQVNRALAKAADFLANDLCRRRVLEHRDALGRGASVRYEAEGYVNWTMVAENIAYGQESAAEVVQAWMRSAGHRRNILESAAGEIGVGVRVAENGQLYWVQAFGSRR